MSLTLQVEELVLLRCSLLPDEILEFILPSPNDVEVWTKILDACSQGNIQPCPVPCPARFTVKIRGAHLWFEIGFSDESPVETKSFFNVTVRGDDISRAEQQRMQSIVQEARAQLSQADFPVYELVSLHLLPLLHTEYDSESSSGSQTLPETTLPLEIPHHALLTSHHLKSPQKRRSLQQWSTELRLCGFAKVGHPGVIYCSGTQPNVKEFVSRIKDMPWLALKVRFVDALPQGASQSTVERPRGSWLEIEKVGEVVREMRMLGRERYILDLGIGSAGGK